MHITSSFVLSTHPNGPSAENEIKQEMTFTQTFRLLSWLLRFVRVGFSDELSVLAGAVKVVEGSRYAVAHLGGRSVPPVEGRAAAARPAVLGVQHVSRPHSEVVQGEELGTLWLMDIVTFCS